MRSTLLIGTIAVFASSSLSQTIPEDARLIGGPCEGCEAVFEYGEKFLAPADTLPDFSEDGPRIRISGTIFRPDGTTPADGVILYIYHTDQRGVYPTTGTETGWARRHGYLRGWVKTDRSGAYSFHTLKPGTYPDRAAPAHIHPVILEPDGKYYWIAEYHFAGDPLLTERERSPESPRGGSTGLIEFKKEGDLLVGKRDIVLGKNVPGY